MVPCIFYDLNPLCQEKSERQNFFSSSFFLSSYFFSSCKCRRVQQGFFVISRLSPTQCSAAALLIYVVKCTVCAIQEQQDTAFGFGVRMFLHMAKWVKIEYHNMLCKMRYHGFSHTAYRAHFHLLDTAMHLAQIICFHYLGKIASSKACFEGCSAGSPAKIAHARAKKRVQGHAWSLARPADAKQRRKRPLPPSRLLLRLRCCGLLSWPFCMVKVEFAIMAFSFSLLLLLLLSQLLCWVERLRLHSLAVLARPKFCFSGPSLGSSAIRFSANTRSEIFPCKNQGDYYWFGYLAAFIYLCHLGQQQFSKVAL